MLNPTPQAASCGYNAQRRDNTVCVDVMCGRVGNVYGRTARWDSSGILATVYKNAGDRAGARGYFVL